MPATTAIDLHLATSAIDNERFGTDGRWSGASSRKGRIRADIHIASDATFGAERYIDTPNPFVCVTLTGSSAPYFSDANATMYFDTDDLEQLTALRDACNVALRHLRKMKGA